MAYKLKEALGIQEAMDNLAAIAEIDMGDPPPIGIVKKNRIVTNEEEFPRGSIEWLSGEGGEVLLELLDATYRGVRNHLQDLYQNPEVNWENERTKKGIAATMALVGESAEKMDHYFAHRLGKPLSQKIREREEFRSLQQFYFRRFIKKFQGDIQEEWAEEWTESESGPFLDAAQSSLKDFEAIQKDREYELFYVRNEEGSSYFDPNLLRNLKVTVDFETEGKTFEEDPLLKIRSMHDRDLQSSANQILGDCHSAIEDFFKIARKFQENHLVNALSMTVIALFLAANPRHLIQNTIGKSCLEYFKDFHRFLRSCFKTTEYQKWIAYSPEKGEKEAVALLTLTHLLCRSFFHRVGGVKQESIGLIHRCMRKGEKEKKGKKASSKPEGIWSEFFLEDENFRELMAKFPNGPLFKILDLIREEEEIPFDPIAQENLPFYLYEVRHKGDPIDILRIPAPLRQAFINKAEIIDEFRGFLRSLYAEDPPGVHLIVNLQDRTSWREHARSRALESLQKNAEFSEQIYVLTLPKDTDFYYQSNEYVHLNRAQEFIETLKEQLASPEEYGYFFPPSWKTSDLVRFADSLLPAIHRHFFQSKETLTRQSREDFIEIFYQFLILRAIDLFEPDSISFSCKDAVDTGAAQAASFYGFLKLLTGDFSKKEEHDFFRWLLYTPALLVRERAVDVERLTRTITVLERIEREMAENEKAILQDFSELYDPKTFKTLGVKET